MNPAPYQPGYLKSQNRKLVFDLFTQHKNLSRADIVRLTGMSFPTASKAVDFLMSRNIVVETEQKATVDNGLGRRSHMLRFNPSAYNAIGLDIEGNFAEIGLVDMSGKILQKKVRRFSDFTSREELVRLAKQVCKMQEAASSPVLGIGIGFPSNINPATHEIVSFETLNIQKPVSFRSMFAPLFEEIPEPVCVDNDVNLACMGEVYLREQDGDSGNLAYLTLGTGFGAGIILNGHLWQGVGFKAGEIGNAVAGPLYPGDEPKPFEQFINIHAINQRFGIPIEDSPPITEDQRHEIIEFILPYLVSSIYNMVYLLDIEQFVLSGFIPRLLGDALHLRLAAAVNKLLKARERSVAIVPPRSHNAVLVGGASMIFDSQIFNQLSE